MSTTRKTSARKNRRIRKPARKAEPVLIAVDLETFERFHSLAKRLAHDVDPQYTMEELVELAEAGRDALYDPATYAPRICNEIVDAFCKAIERSDGEEVTVPFALVRRLGLLERLGGQRFRLHDRLSIACDQATRRRETEAAAPRAEARIAAPPRPEDFRDRALAGSIPCECHGAVEVR